MYQMSLRAKVAAVGGTGILAIGLLPLATGVAAAGATVVPITGGTAIQSNTARVGGSGAWTTLTGPTIHEGSIGEWPVGEKITLGLPANFEWNTARVTAPAVTSCDKESSAIVYSGSGATITILARSGPCALSVCTVSFGPLLQVRPIARAWAAAVPWIRNWLWGPIATPT